MSREAGGAKRSGLTEPWTAGQSRVVMAAVSDTRSLRRDDLRDERVTRWSERRAEGDDAVPSQVEIRCVCAFTYMNAVFRKNLTEALAGDASDEDTALDPGGAFSGVTGIALSRRTIVTWTSGVSDPLRAGRGAKKGATKWGVAHAPLSGLLRCDSARTP